MRPPANIGPMAECYQGTSLTGGPPLAAICQQMLWFGCFEYYPYIQNWQFIQLMLMCGASAKPVAHLMKLHQLQWEVAQVKALMNSNMTLTVPNLHKKTDPKVQQPRFK